MSDQQSGYGGLNRFDQVDATGEADTFLAFLDRVDAIPETMSRRRRSFDRLALRPGMVVADIGCGTGTAARELAALVDPGGRAHGFDISEQFIAVARTRAAAANRQVDFEIAAASALPLPDASLDAYRAERVYMHLKQPEAALAEAFRVLRPGGRILIMDQDWDSLLFDGDLAATRAVTRAFADSMINGTIARRMRPLLRQAGFDDIAIAPETTAVLDGSAVGWMADTVGKAALAAGLDPAMVNAWMDDQRRRIAEDRFLYSRHGRAPPLSRAGSPLLGGFDFDRGGDGGCGGGSRRRLQRLQQAGADGLEAGVGGDLQAVEVLHVEHVDGALAEGGDLRARDLQLQLGERAGQAVEQAGAVAAVDLDDRVGGATRCCR